MQKEQFDITGMTCSACSTRVEKSVAKLPGIKEVSVNLLKNSMVASYDESVLDTTGIVQAVEKAGYGAIPKASAQNKSRTTTPAAKPEVSTAQAEYKQMKQRLLLSALFTIPLFYISMGHMNLIIKGKHKKTLIFPVFSGNSVFYSDSCLVVV